MRPAPDRSRILRTPLPAPCQAAVAALAFAALVAFAVYLVRIGLGASLAAGIGGPVGATVAMLTAGRRRGGTKGASSEGTKPSPPGTKGPLWDRDLDG
jgi:hypothetical protein